ncbi:MAG: TonB-dependent receptor [Sphingomonas sp.]
MLLEPKRPDFDGISGYVEGTLGNYARRSGDAAINVPLVGDVLAIRVAGRFERQDGEVKDVVTGATISTATTGACAWGIQFNPAENLRSYTAVNLVDVDEHGGGNVLLAVRPGSTYAALLTPYLQAQQARDPDHISLGVATKDIGKQLLILNNTEWQASDTLSFKNVVSYARDRANTASDGDATPLQISDLLGALPDSYNVNTRRITEELQARYDNGTFRLQVGGFYLNEKTVDPLTFQTVNPMQYGIVSGGPIILPTAPYLLPLLSIQDAAEAHGESKALFAQASYKLTPALTATAGFRWTWDSFGGHIEQYLSPGSFTILPALLGPAGAAAQAVGSNLCLYDAVLGQYKYSPNCTYYGFSGASDGPTWQLGLDWQADRDTLLYAVSRRGYKSGGFNPIVLLASPQGDQDPLFDVRPERVTDAEIGIKRDWTFGTVRARTNISAFYTWYNDIQVNQRQVFSGSDVVTNAKSAVVKGIEFEGLLVPVRALTITGTYSFNSARYTDYHTLAIPRVRRQSGRAEPGRQRHALHLCPQA